MKSYLEKAGAALCRLVPTEQARNSRTLSYTLIWGCILVVLTIGARVMNAQ